MWLEIVSGAIFLATEIFKYINTENARRYLDEMTDLEKELIEENAKGYDSDDRRIEYLYERFKVAQKAFNSEIALNKSASN